MKALTKRNMKTQDQTDIMREMLKNAVHFGHQSQKWNPKMAPFLFGKRKGIHIFDLQKTAQCLEKALNFLKKQVAEGKIILMVSTKQQAASILRETAKKCSMPYVTQRWIGGMLTNFETIKKRIKYLIDLKETEKKGEFEKYTKKEAANLRKTITKLEDALGGISTLTRLPDVLLVIDPIRDSLAVKEAQKLKIPIIAVLDSNADPTDINYPIPANDDALKSLKYLIAKIEEAFSESKK